MQTYVLCQVDVTSELLHWWWCAHVQSNNKTINVCMALCVTLDLYAQASGRVDKNRTRGRTWLYCVYNSVELSSYTCNCILFSFFSHEPV